MTTSRLEHENPWGRCHLHWLQRQGPETLEKWGSDCVQNTSHPLGAVCSHIRSWSRAIYQEGSWGQKNLPGTSISWAVPGSALVCLQLSPGGVSAISKWHGYCDFICKDCKGPLSPQLLWASLPIFSQGVGLQKRLESKNSQAIDK